MSSLISSTARFNFEEANYSSGGQIELANVRYCILVVIHHGTGIVRADEFQGTLEAGQCGLYDGGRGFSLVCPPDISTRISVCAATGGGFIGSLKGRGRRLSACVEPTDLIVTLIRLGSGLREIRSYSDDRLRFAIGEALISAYLVASEQDAETEVPGSVLRAREYLESHFFKPCNLAQLAGVVGVSREYLVSSFRKHFGITPVRYLWELRTQRATNLVQNTDLNLAEIADRCGYKSQYHLSREIKKVTGMSPRQLRR